MNHEKTYRCLRLACLILAAAFLFLSTGAAPNPAPSRYDVHIAASDRQICVGQTAQIGVSYNLNQGFTDRGEPSIFLDASQYGTVGPNNPAAGGAGGGVVGFTYTGKKPGLEHIFANINGGVDGSDTLDIRVLKDCSYTYVLKIIVKDTESEGDIHYQYTNVYDANGKIALSAPGQGPSPEQSIQKLQALIPLFTVEEFTVPQKACNVPATTWKGLLGDGTLTVDAQLVKAGDEEKVRIILSAASVQQTPSFSIPCEGGNAAGQLPLSFSADTFIQEDFPVRGGSRYITIDLLENWKKRDKDKSLTYQAHLDVRRVK